MHKTYYPTGNEYVSLPMINESCEIESINYLSMRDRGLIEICGDPFLKPVILIEGVEKPLENIKWARAHYWIPTFTANIGTLQVKGAYIAPLERKGFILRWTLTDETKTIDGHIGIKGHFSKVLHSINESKIIEGKKHVYHSLWNQNLMFDFRTGITLFSFGFKTDDGFDHIHYTEEPMDSPLNSAINFELYKAFSIEKGHSQTVDIYCGLGLEEVGAATQAIEFQRETTDGLKAELCEWLKARTQIIGDDHLMTLLNLNQFFNYFYASGKTLDTEEMILCTSRSPRYYVSAAYWDRDSLLWSFPAFLMMDSKIARHALEYVYSKQIRNAGIHSRYIDGTILEPGFELDELCAFILALGQYLEHTEDFTILEEFQVKKGIQMLYEKLMLERHPEIELYKTFLMPTDDMHTYRYLTYNNVLVWKVFGIYEKLFKYYGQSERAQEVITRMNALKEAIFEHLIVIKSDQKCFAWSGDLNGHHDFYDEPPGSLTLLAYYGFVDAEDAIFKNTLNALYSDAFPHYFKDTTFEELGCSHADHPWILAISNSLLNGRKEIAYDMLRKTKMDHYIACESIDEHSGLPTTGEHFATCAGFLAYTIYKSWRTTNDKTISWNWNNRE
ncbi:glycoside hydrolase family 125 protein [Fusibacter sp. 3D3]|uniref:glycoside hydrolase family 125 protein n=1 Tax=Fusibacter sp. 3D3 TaxID=1048380 RepID=UPI0008531F56|nr:glycoside hydrolase family 125 protein [Fusibacter sp. 3D3]GAU78453.1 hypothetical protein F3D3_3087 [Fusibacter sp. 3D3]